jgi:hypothetical protein
MLLACYSPLPRQANISPVAAFRQLVSLATSGERPGCEQVASNSPFFLRDSHPRQGARFERGGYLRPRSRNPAVCGVGDGRAPPGRLVAPLPQRCGVPKTTR